jgi:hypothetical protein
LKIGKAVIPDKLADEVGGSTGDVLFIRGHVQREKDRKLIMEQFSFLKRGNIEDINVRTNGGAPWTGMLKVVDFGFIEEKAGRWIRLTFNIELHTL